MAVVDERGRIGGRINLIDAVAAFLILVLIPVAFGAYLLFRTPPPVLRSVHPAELYQGGQLRIEVIGENLRPFMRVSFDRTQGQSYMIASPRSAMVDLPEIPPGKYDIVLYDHMQEVSRLPKALTLLPLSPTPNVDMRVAGSFKGLTGDRLKSVKTGDKFMNGGAVVAEIENLAPPVPSSLTITAGYDALRVPLTGQTDIPGVLKVKCFVSTNTDGGLKCSVPGPIKQTDVMPGGMLSLAGPDGWLSFQIDKVLN